MVSKLETNFEAEILRSKELVKIYSGRLAGFNLLLEDFNTRVTDAKKEANSKLSDLELYRQEDYISYLANFRDQVVKEANRIVKSLEYNKLRLQILSNICAHDNLYFDKEDQGIRIYRCDLCNEVA